MALTGIGDARTPATPVEVTLAASTGQPDANQEVLLFARQASSPGTATNYLPKKINNSGDSAAALTECNGYFGSGAEAVKMVQALIKGLEAISSSIFPQITVVPLPFAAAEGSNPFGAADVALTNARNTKAEFIVSPYAGVSSGSLAPSATSLKNHCALVSGATRTANNQFGSFGVFVDRAVTDPSTLPTPDTQFLVPVWLRDTGTAGDAPAYSVGEVAAAVAGRLAAQAIPFNPLDDETVGALAAPAKQSDWPSVGDSSESESALQKGWTPLYVKPNGEVAFVRSITARLSADGTGTPVVTDYYDVQDFMCLYYFRKTLYTRFKQKDFKKKNSGNVMKRMKAEAIRLAQSFEDQEMFQAVKQLAKFFKVQRATTDRHATEAYVPVNVVPGLHRKKVNIEAGTQFDTFVV